MILVGVKSDVKRLLYIAEVLGVRVLSSVFFVKPKKAYEIYYGRGCAEMWIRESCNFMRHTPPNVTIFVIKHKNHIK